MPTKQTTKRTIVIRERVELSDHSYAISGGSVAGAPQTCQWGRTPGFKVTGLRRVWCKGLSDVASATQPRGLWFGNNHGKVERAVHGVWESGLRMFDCPSTDLVRRTWRHEASCNLCGCVSNRGRRAAPSINGLSRASEEGRPERDMALSGSFVIFVNSNCGSLKDHRIVVTAHHNHS